MEAMGPGVRWLERRQVPLYLAALALGALTGVRFPGLAPPAEVAIGPVLGLLLYATFLGVPFAQIRRGFTDWRFLAAVSVVNFALVPVVVWGLSRILAHEQVLLVGVLFVLLTPCVDYVIAFTGIAGGAQDRLLAAAPLLMLAQMLLLPLYLWAFVGADFVGSVDLGPFLDAFLLLIVAPLAAAVLTRYAAARARWAAALASAVTGSMVPLMMATLAVVVASQIGAVTTRLDSLLLTVPVYLLFAAVLVPVGAAAGRIAGLDVPGRRAVVLSGVTRNSLVVLPLVLALPPAFGLAPLVVVTQTLVELIVMVVLVRLVPRLIPPEPGAAAGLAAAR